MSITEYRTLAKSATAELKIEKSLFIGHAVETRSTDQAHQFINQIRTEHAQATHNCYAYILGLGKGQETHFHDHGEPSGTAGKPILGAILRLELTNTVVVVTRYFGGRKLGVRGLIDAYGLTATTVLQKAGIKIVPVTREYELEVDYANLDFVSYLITQAGGSITPIRYGETVALAASIPINMADQLTNTLTEKQLTRNIGEIPSSF